MQGILRELSVRLSFDSLLCYSSVCVCERMRALRLGLVLGFGVSRGVFARISWRCFLVVFGPAVLEDSARNPKAQDPKATIPTTFDYIDNPISPHDLVSSSKLRTPRLFILWCFGCGRR